METSSSQPGEEASSCEAAGELVHLSKHNLLSVDSECPVCVHAINELQQLNVQTQRDVRAENHLYHLLCSICAVETFSLTLYHCLSVRGTLGVPWFARSLLVAGSSPAW